MTEDKPLEITLFKIRLSGFGKQINCDLTFVKIIHK